MGAFLDFIKNTCKNTWFLPKTSIFPFPHKVEPKSRQQPPCQTTAVSNDRRVDLQIHVKTYILNQKPPFSHTPTSTRQIASNDRRVDLQIHVKTYILNQKPPLSHTPTSTSQIKANDRRVNPPGNNRRVDLPHKPLEWLCNVVHIQLGLGH